MIDLLVVVVVETFTPTRFHVPTSFNPYQTLTHPITNIFIWIPLYSRFILKRYYIKSYLDPTQPTYLDQRPHIHQRFISFKFQSSLPTFTSNTPNSITSSPIRLRLYAPSQPNPTFKSSTDTLAINHPHLPTFPHSSPTNIPPQPPLPMTTYHFASAEVDIDNDVGMDIHLNINLNPSSNHHPHNRFQSQSPQTYHNSHTNNDSDESGAMGVGVVNQDEFVTTQLPSNTHPNAYNYIEIGSASRQSATTSPSTRGSFMQQSVGYGSFDPSLEDPPLNNSSLHLPREPASPKTVKHKRGAVGHGTGGAGSPGGYQSPMTTTTTATTNATKPVSSGMGGWQQWQHGIGGGGHRLQVGNNNLTPQNNNNTTNHNNNPQNKTRGDTSTPKSRLVDESLYAIDDEDDGYWGTEVVPQRSCWGNGKWGQKMMRFEEGVKSKVFSKQGFVVFCLFFFGITLILALSATVDSHVNSKPGLDREDGVDGGIRYLGDGGDGVVGQGGVVGHNNDNHHRHGHSQHNDHDVDYGTPIQSPELPIGYVDIETERVVVVGDGKPTTGGIAGGSVGGTDVGHGGVVGGNAVGADHSFTDDNQHIDDEQSTVVQNQPVVDTTTTTSTVVSASSSSSTTSSPSSTTPTSQPEPPSSFDQTDPASLADNTNMVNLDGTDRYDDIGTLNNPTEDRSTITVVESSATTTTTTTTPTTPTPTTADPSSTTTTTTTDPTPHIDDGDVISLDKQEV